jgi:hypothetical protein
MVCNPAASSTSWSNAPDGQGCSPGSQCTAGACGVPPPLPCDHHVPGDYSTIQAAITALRAADASAVVCVADGTYHENLTDPGGWSGKLTITGTSAAKVVIDGTVDVPFALGDHGTITFENVTINQSVTDKMVITLRWCVVKGGVNVSPANHLPNGQFTSALVDACDLSGYNAMYAVFTEPPTPNSIQVTVQNSYLHGAATGIYLELLPAGLPAPGSATFVHNTVQGNITGISLNGVNNDLTPLFANNLITGNTTGITLAQLYGDFHDNALFNNSIDYAGAAAPGMGDVTAAPLLTGTTPPGLAAGSPLIGAGDATLVTMYDFFGKPRNGRADIGAVEGP